MTYQLIPWWIISYFYTLYIPWGLFLEMTYFVKYVDKKNWKKDDFAFFTKKQPKSLQFCQSNQPIIFQTYVPTNQVLNQVLTSLTSLAIPHEVKLTVYKPRYNYHWFSHAFFLSLWFCHINILFPDEQTTKVYSFHIHT